MEKLLEYIDRYLFLVLFGVIVLRIGFLFVNDLALLGDESYYWEWSRRPDWCYFSKPPMVAWLIAIFTNWLGHSVAILRLPAVILGTVCIWFFYATAKSIYGKTSAAFAVLLMLATPDNVLSNLIMTIDAPLTCFWMISVYCLHKAIFAQRLSYWFLAGLATALALLSKQVAALMPLMLLLFILLEKQRYHWLRREFLIYLLPVVISAIPICIWNQQHNWVMFGHSKEHFTTQLASSYSAVFKNFFSLLFYQLILISPVIFVIAVICSIKMLVNLCRLSAEQQFLVVMGPLLLLGVLLLSLIQKVQGNWPMPFYLTTLILLSGLWRQVKWQMYLEMAVKVGLVMVAITYLLPNLLLKFNLNNTVVDPIKRFNYWPEVATNVQTERIKVISDLQNSFVVTLGHRNLASQLAFYLPDHPKVFRYEVTGKVKSQYELWDGPIEFNGRNALIVSDNANLPEKLQNAFQNLNFLQQIANPMHPEQPFYLFIGNTLTNWPPLSLQALSSELN